MPIFQTGQGLGLYADVPGCGGAAMIRHLEVRFGPLAFHDPAHTDGPPPARWSRTSPQHVGRRTLARLFPPGFFAASFAIVRHPADRLRSVYAFQRDVEGAIPRTTEFGEWLEDIAERSLDDPYVFDNAVRPMTDLVPEDAEVFRFEEGSGPIIDWLDRFARAPGPAFDLRTSHPEEGEALSALDVDRIAELYAADFTRFGYHNPGEGRAAPFGAWAFGA